MGRKRIDNRILNLINNGVVKKHRSMFVVVGKKAKDQVVLLHHMLMKSSTDRTATTNILWCSKKETCVGNNRFKKYLKSIKNKVKAGKLDLNIDNQFELFIVSNNIRFCYYNESHKILGNTYDMCILQDFQALTPNLLARTIETVEGGGLIIILLSSISSLEQLYTMEMDVHKKLRTEGYKNVECHFNQRFVLSLSSCKQCLVVDDDLKVLPITSSNLEINATVLDSSAEVEQDSNIFKKPIEDIPESISSLLYNSKTVDQFEALCTFIKTIVEKKSNSIVSLIAARGRGKSATLGLAVAGAVKLGYSNIYLSSPSPENLNTLFEFIFIGLNVLGYEENCDYGVVRTTSSESNEIIMKINIYRDHRQMIQYVYPKDASQLIHADLLIIDEAAAIPLPQVKSMLGPNLIFLASTISGYEGTGRSLSLKLIQELREESQANLGGKNSDKIVEAASKQRRLYEITLNESIRYKPGDQVEEWLTNVLCLDTSIHPSISSSNLSPDRCQLYYINKDTLFSYHKASELFLQRLVALYVASHYKNTPNDLQIMSDAPTHHLFCLLNPIDSKTKSLPEILVVIQVCLEGKISKKTMESGLGRGRRAAGDLIPWTVAQQYQDEDFAQLTGARIVRIATHPDYQSQRYGTRAVQLLKQYYGGKIQYSGINLKTKTNKIACDEKAIKSQTSSQPSLLLELTERKPEPLDYLGVSFGLTSPLFKFWNRSNFTLVYLRQTANEITGEYSCIMLSNIKADDESYRNRLDTYWNDFRRRFIMLLSYSFKIYPAQLAFSIIHNSTIPNVSMNKQIFETYFTSRDIKRLEMYSNNVVDYHLIMDLLPSLAKFYFSNFMNDIHISSIQATILLGLGLQHKTVEEVAEELDLSVAQLLGFLNRIVRKSTRFFNRTNYITNGMSASGHIEGKKRLNSQTGFNDQIRKKKKK